MKISDPLNQYVQIIDEAMTKMPHKVKKSLKRDIMEVLQLYMVLPNRVNFTQMAKFGQHVEQTYRNTFVKQFDWLSFNSLLATEYFAKDKRVAIAIDPSYIPKSGKHTSFLDYFWSGAAGQAKWGLEILAIAMIGIDTHDCMTLYAQQTPDHISLERYNSNLIDWYSKIIRQKREQLIALSKYIVADAFFSVHTFVEPMKECGFHVISRLHDNAHLRYALTDEEQKQQEGKVGAPKKYGDKIDLNKLNMNVFKKVDLQIDNGELYAAVVYVKALKREVKLVVWKSPTGICKLYFSTDTQMSAKDVIEYYRTRFQIEFRIRDAKQYAGLTHSQARKWDKLHFAFNASFTSVNIAKVMIQRNSNAFSMKDIKYLLYNTYLIRRIFARSGFCPNPKLSTKLVKELLDLTDCAA